MEGEKVSPLTKENDMEPIAIRYDRQGVPVNLPEVDPVLLYGLDGAEAVGPVLGQWDSTLECWTDHRYGQIEWGPVFFAVPPPNPCKDLSTPTYGNTIL